MISDKAWFFETFEHSRNFRSVFTWNINAKCIAADTIFKMLFCCAIFSELGFFIHSYTHMKVREKCEATNEQCKSVCVCWRKNESGLKWKRVKAHIVHQLTQQWVLWTCSTNCLYGVHIHQGSQIWPTFDADRPSTRSDRSSGSVGVGRARSASVGVGRAG